MIEYFVTSKKYLNVKCHILDLQYSFQMYNMAAVR